MLRAQWELMDRWKNNFCSIIVHLSHCIIISFTMSSSASFRMSSDCHHSLFNEIFLDFNLTLTRVHHLWQDDLLSDTRRILVIDTLIHMRHVNPESKLAIILFGDVINIFLSLNKLTQTTLQKDAS